MITNAQIRRFKDTFNLNLEFTYDTTNIKSILKINITDENKNTVCRSTFAIDTINSFAEISEIFIFGTHRNIGISRYLLSELVSICQANNISKIICRATLDGQYVWARLGFLPDIYFWNSIMKLELQKCLNRYRHEIDRGHIHLIDELLQSEMPQSVAAISRVADVVDRTGDRHGTVGGVSLGYALLMEGPTWSGTMQVTSTD